MNEYAEVLSRILSQHGFEVQADIDVFGLHFDLVAEDSTRLVFIDVRGSGIGWLDDFADQQAAIASLSPEVPFGRKWRDVYLVVLMQDSIESTKEIEAAEIIRADTTAARKLILDVSNISARDEDSLTRLLAPVLPVSLSSPTIGDENLMTLLRSLLVADGFDGSLVASLQRSMSTPGHSCVNLLIDEAK